MDDGLSLDQLETLIAPIASSEGLIGLNVTCFNPEKDPDGTCGASLAGLLEATVVT